MAYETVDPELLRTSASQSAQLADTTTGLVQRLQGIVANTVWTGPSADSFNGAFEQIIATLTGSASQFQDASCDLICAADIVETDQATTTLTGT